MATNHRPRSIPARIVYRIPRYSMIRADQKCDSAAMERSARFVAVLLLRHSGSVAAEFSENRDRLFADIVERPLWVRSGHRAASSTADLSGTCDRHVDGMHGPYSRPASSHPR